jgi:DNA-binding transcriptional regulator YdaS (Cro superfamily)
MDKILRSVIDVVGSKAELARRCRVTPQAVTRWITAGIPANRVPQVSHITGIPVHKLLPEFRETK